MLVYMSVAWVQIFLQGRRCTHQSLLICQCCQNMHQGGQSKLVAARGPPPAYYCQLLFNILSQKSVTVYKQVHQTATFLAPPLIILRPLCIWIKPCFMFCSYMMHIKQERRQSRVASPKCHPQYRNYKRNEKVMAIIQIF